MGGVGEDPQAVYYKVPAGGLYRTCNVTTIRVSVSPAGRYRVILFMGPVEEALLGSLFLELKGETTVNKGLKKLLVLSTKRIGLGVPDTTTAAGECHKASLGISCC